MPKGVYPRNPRSGTTLSERLAFYSDRSNGPDSCWIWKAARTGNGYGCLYWKGAIRRAHRLALEDAIGESLPAGQTICHRCDVPLCINPRHLFVATQAENIADMNAKGRSRHALGAACANAKLTPEAVREIRASTERTTKIAAKFGINRSTVRLIVRRVAWAHVDG